MERKKRLELAKKSLLGISLGDAFGESFFGETDTVLAHIKDEKIPPTTWEFTDDTVMAIAVFEQLEKYEDIHQNALVSQFSINHQLDVNRGYGATARRILREIEEGGDWKEISSNVFEGMGSMGNGASMRVGPIGAYFYDDIEKVKKIATKSAEVTHTNIEAISGAIAVAVATAIATKMRVEKKYLNANEFIEKVFHELPDTDTKSKIKKSLTIPKTYGIETVKSILGNGTQIIAQDTVPFSIWCAAHYHTHFEDAMWKAVSILGDRDTICAIVAGIVIMSCEEASIPQKWIENVEKIDASPFRNK